MYKEEKRWNDVRVIVDAMIDKLMDLQQVLFERDDRYFFK